MSKHTPGPWETVYVGCGDWDLRGPITREDWKLAAAAPNLLYALQFIADNTEENKAINKVAKAAIDKAIGGVV